MTHSMCQLQLKKRKRDDKVKQLGPVYVFIFLSKPSWHRGDSCDQKLTKAVKTLKDVIN